MSPPQRIDVERSAGGDDAKLAVAPWSVGSAFALVAVALSLALLAGAVVSAIGDSGFSPLTRALAAGGVLLGLYLALLGIVWGYATRSGERFGDAVGLMRPTGLGWYAAALGAAVIGWLFSAAFMTLLAQVGLELPREDLAVFRLLPGGWAGTGITLVLLLVVAPFAEEVVYRGVLQTSLADRWGAASALVVSSAVFSAVHLSLVGLVPLFVAGALFGWLFAKSRSLWVAIVAHAAYNALGVLALFVSKSTGVL